MGLSMRFFPVIRLQGGQQGFHRLTPLAGETLQQIPIPLPVVHQSLQGWLGVEPDRLQLWQQGGGG